MRRVPGVVLGVVVASLVAACGADQRVINVPKCDNDEAILVAQSVPEAEFVPCFDDLPKGWGVERVDVSDNGTRVVLNSDRAGEDAATLVYEDRCDLERLEQVTSDQPEVTSFERIRQHVGGFESWHVAQFQGGCVTVFFSFGVLDDAPVLARRTAFGYTGELLDALQLVSRVDINEVISRQNDRIRV